TNSTTTKPSSTTPSASARSWPSSKRSDSPPSTPTRAGTADPTSPCAQRVAHTALARGQPAKTGAFPQAKPLREDLAGLQNSRSDPHGLRPPVAMLSERQFESTCQRPLLVCAAFLSGRVAH